MAINKQSFLILSETLSVLVLKMWGIFSVDHIYLTEEPQIFFNSHVCFAPCRVKLRLMIFSVKAGVQPVMMCHCAVQ